MLIVKNAYKWIFLLIPVLTGLVAGAQQPGFIHIQSENDHPFYVRLNGSAYPSSATGYLVIPRVPVGEHTLVMSFPGNEFPPYAFQCTIANGPRGFSLKQGVDNSWSLFDMVSFIVTRGAVASQEQLLVAAGKPAETIAEKPAVVTPVKPSETAPVKGSVRPVSGIQKIFGKSSLSGIDEVYIVINGSKVDTVALFIPVLPDEKPKQTASVRWPSPASRGIQAQTRVAQAFISRLFHQFLLSN